MKKVLILGISGMLGSSVYAYFRSQKSFLIGGTFRDRQKIKPFLSEDKIFEFDASDDINKQILRIYDNWPFDYIINCIGVIKPFCNDLVSKSVLNAIKINSLFPHELANSCLNISSQIRIIQIATDCVYKGDIGNYDEYASHDPIDVYGKTKSLGEVHAKNTLNLRCSIIGKELEGELSLLEWFLSNRDGDSVSGFEDHLWNGVTTLQFAQLCQKIIEKELLVELQKSGKTVHYVINESVSKFELLSIFNIVFKRKIQINKIQTSNPIDRTLSSKLYKQKLVPMIDAIKSYKQFVDEQGIYEANEFKK